jgi:transposase InsO family protein
VPAHSRSDHGPEFVAKTVRGWIATVGAKMAYIAPGSPWENGYVESFNARLRDELLDGEIFYTLREAASGDRKLAAPLQRRTPARLARLPAARAGGVRAGPRRLARGATPTGFADHRAGRGAQADAELTFAADHPVGAGQGNPSFTLTVSVWLGRCFRLWPDVDLSERHIRKARVGAEAKQESTTASNRAEFAAG